MTPAICPGADKVRAEAAALWAARLSDGRLSVQDQAEFQAWLDADPLNAEAVDETVRSWRVVEAYASTPQLLDLRGRALASARMAHMRQTMAAAARTRRLWAPLAAGLAAAIGLAGLWLSPADYETHVGERRVVLLEDGSKLSLDGDTKVLVRYAFGRRRLWLERGRAKFDVAKDPLRPFTVDAGEKEVVATGTSFSVELVRKQVHVILYEGHVAVLDTSARASAQRSRREPAAVVTADRAFTPGHEFVAPAVDQKRTREPSEAVVAAIDPVRSLAWESGEIVFENEPLSTAVERVNRYAATRLVLDDEAVGQIRISGVFRAGDVTAFVQGVTAAFPVRDQPDGDSIVLSQDFTRKLSHKNF